MSNIDYEVYGGWKERTRAQKKKYFLIKKVLKLDNCMKLEKKRKEKSTDY